MTSVHRQGELDNCQSLLDQSRVECKELASKVHSLQNDIDKHKVQTSIAGVSGVSALALMEHFAGVASLQADRLRQLGQARAGKGHFTLGIGLGQALGSASGGPLPERAGMQEPSSVSGNFIDGGGGALSSSLSPQDSHSQLGTSAWVRHWSILEAHVLAKQNAALKDASSRADETHLQEVQELQTKLEAANEEVKKERNKSKPLKILLFLGFYCVGSNVYPTLNHLTV